MHEAIAKCYKIHIHVCGNNINNAVLLFDTHPSPMLEMAAICLNIHPCTFDGRSSWQ